MCIVAWTMAEENYNLDELISPSFVTEAYILNLLKTVEKDDNLEVSE